MPALPLGGIDARATRGGASGTVIHQHFALHGVLDALQRRGVCAKRHRHKEQCRPAPQLTFSQPLNGADAQHPDSRALRSAPRPPQPPARFSRTHQHGMPGFGQARGQATTKIASATDDSRSMVLYVMKNIFITSVSGVVVDKVQSLGDSAYRRLAERK